MRPTLLLFSAPNKTTPIGYATSLLRKSDNDAFYPSFFYRPSVRPAYLAIRALNVELAGIDEAVSNPMVGRMRYQWWRDSVKGAFENRPPPHPVAQLLSSLPQLSSLSPYHFTRLINAREAHFLNPSFNTLQDLAEYSAGTQASLLYLLLQASTPTPRRTGTGTMTLELPHSRPFEHKGDEHMEDSLGNMMKKSSADLEVEKGLLLKEPDSLTIDHAASHLAVAITISILLRSIPHHAAKRISIIPAEIAARHSLTEEALFRQGPSAPGIRESVATLVGIAEAELRTARACFDGTSGIPEHVAAVFLSGTPARSFLARLASPQIEFDVFNGGVHKRYWKLPFQIWSDSRKKEF